MTWRIGFTDPTTSTPRESASWLLVLRFTVAGQFASVGPQISMTAWGATTGLATLYDVISPLVLYWKAVAPTVSDPAWMLAPNSPPVSRSGDSIGFAIVMDVADENERYRLLRPGARNDLYTAPRSDK